MLEIRFRPFGLVGLFGLSVPAGFSGPGTQLRALARRLKENAVVVWLGSGIWLRIRSLAIKLCPTSNIPAASFSQERAPA